MKLQFAFGNPRKGSKKRKKLARKAVAKRRKKAKNKSVKSKLKEAIKMAKKRRLKIRVKSKSRKGKRKNPRAAIIRKGGKQIGREFSPTNRREHDAARGKLISLKAKYKAAPLGPEKNALMREMVKLGNKLDKDAKYQKTLLRYKEEGADVKEFDLKERSKGAKTMAKRRKKKKTSGKKAKKAAKKAVAKKARKGSKRRRKGGKRRMSKAQRRALKKMLAANKKARKGKKKTAKRGKRRKSKGSKRRRVRMVTHRHAASTRHIKKGTTFRFKSKAKKGKRSITVSGRVKFNPFRSNPLKNLSAQTKKYMGIDASELTALAVGGALVPVVNAGIGKIPGMSSVVSKINQYVGPQAAGSVVPILAGIALNATAEHAYKGKGSEYLKLAGEGLCAAGFIGLVMGLSAKYVAPALGLSGINFTPGMRGINYTPRMGDIRYTPRMGVMPQLNGMGIQPTLGKSPDFGAANYGGRDGYRQSSADFGAYQSQDSEAEGLDDQGNSYSASMN